MKTIRLSLLTLLLIPTLLLPNSTAQDVTQWHLPEGAKARFGKGGISGNIVFSPDGTQLAVATQIGIWIYDTAAQKELKLYTGHPDEVWEIAFSPDGSTLASCGGWRDNRIYLWDAATGKHKTTLDGHAEMEDTTSIAFSPDGSILASGGDDGYILLWDTITAMPFASFIADEEESIETLVFSPDGRLIASGGWNQPVRLWDVSSQQNIATLKADEYVIQTLAFSPDGSTLASGGGDETIRLWDIADQTLKASLSGPTRHVWRVAFSPDGHTLASSSDDGTVFLWDAASYTLKATLTGHTRLTRSVTFSPNGHILASGSEDGTVRLWDARSGAHQATLTGHSVGLSNLAFSPDGVTLAIGSWDSTVQLWDIAGRAPLTAIFTGHLEGVESIAFSPDGTTLASGGNGGWEDHKVFLWDVAAAAAPWPSEVECRFPISSHHKAAFLRHINQVSAVAFSPDGTTLAASEGTGNNTIILLDVASGASKAILSTPRTWNSDGVASIAFSPDGKTLASGSYRALRIWDVPSATLKATLEGHSHWISNVVFSPDGRTLASTGYSSPVRLWDVPSATGKATLNGPADGTWSVAFSPDGTLLATGGTYRNSTVQLWDVPNGRHKTTLTGHRDGVTSLVFSPDGGTLASGGGDGTVLLWELPSESEVPGAPVQLAADTNANEQTFVFQNYPNPFNPETWIPYQLVEPAEVTVHIYTASGALIRTLAVGHRSAGTYLHRHDAVYWDGKNERGESVSSGVYFYTFTAGNFTATRKMLIRK